MPLVDKLERISALLQSGSLSQDEFHHAKNQLFGESQTEAPVMAKAATSKMREQLKGALANAEMEYKITRHHCMIRCRHAIKREPRASHFYITGVVTFLWMSLGCMVAEGFYALNPVLVILPAGTMFIGVIFTIRSVYEHGIKLVKLNAAKSKLIEIRQQIETDLRALPKI